MLIRRTPRPEVEGAKERERISYHDIVIIKGYQKVAGLCEGENFVGITTPNG